MATKAKKEEDIKEEKTSKQTIPHEKLNKECNNVDYKLITKQDMVQYVLEYAPKDKEWFKQLIKDNRKADKNGKERINFISIKREFCKRYNPSLLPVSKTKESLWDMVKDW
ncbi:MAG: hypothetical protein ACI4S2_03675 [Lachnospiraceae bacterium]